MEWFIDNWFWVLIGVVFIVMHLFGHGGHGGHRGPGGHRHRADSDTKDRPAGGNEPPERHSDHRH